MTEESGSVPERGNMLSLFGTIHTGSGSHASSCVMDALFLLGRDLMIATHLHRLMAPKLLSHISSSK
jgi:hypothetical protein